jgi:hypothetical protein
VLRRQFASAAEAVRECCGGSSRVLRRQFASAAEAVRECRGGASAAEARVPRRRECRGGNSVSLLALLRAIRLW